MGCGNAKEAVVLPPPNPVDRRLAKAAQEEKRKQELARRERQEAAQKAAEDAKNTAISDIVSKLGTLETYWTAGEFESENVKPHFIPPIGPASLLERVPAAPPAIRGTILFATVNANHNGSRLTQDEKSTKKDISGHLSKEPSLTKKASRDASMPLPRHIRPMFIDEALLSTMQRNRNGGGPARILSNHGNNEFSYANAMDVSIAQTYHTNIDAASIGETPIKPIVNASSPVHPPSMVADDLLTPRPPASTEGLSFLSVAMLNGQRANTTTIQPVPRLNETMFLYPSQPFVGRAYLGGPLANMSAGWVRLPCGPVTRKRTTKNIAADHKGEEETTPTTSPRSEETTSGQSDDKKGPYYFAPEVKGFINAQKPHYDVREDGSVAEPIGSHAYEAGGGDEGDDEVHDDGAEKELGGAQEKEGEIDAAEGQDAKIPTIGAVKQIIPRRLEKYFLYPKELTALGIKIEYRHASGIHTVSDAQVGAAAPTSHCYTYNSMTSVSALLISPRVAASSTVGAPIHAPPTVTAAVDEIRAIANHNVPLVYCCPQPIHLTSFYQSANEYFGEDRPNGLSVRVMREVSSGTAAGSLRPPSATAAGGGSAAAANILDEKPLEGCFVTFLNPRPAPPSTDGGPSDRMKDVRSKLFSSPMFSEENSIPLYLFSDPTCGNVWWPVAHRYASAVALLHTERERSTTGDPQQRTDAERAVASLTLAMSETKEELLELQRKRLFMIDEDDIFWLQFRKELSAFLARVLEQNPQPPATSPQPGTDKTKDAELPAIPTSPVSPLPQSLSATTRPKSSEGGQTSTITASVPVPNIVDESFTIPTVTDIASHLPLPIAGHDPAPTANPPADPKNESAMGLQIRFTLSGQYNNTRFVAFNGHGRNNVAEAGAEEDSSTLPQLFSFTDTTRRPRVKPFSKPLAEGAVTMVFPQQLRTSEGEKEMDNTSIDSITHLKYVAGVLSVILDEFTASVVH